VKTRRFYFPDWKAAGMAKIHPAFVEYQRKRFMRPDAARYLLRGSRPHGRLSGTPFGEFKFNPDQPRVPAGNPDGGQWTSETSNYVATISATPSSAVRFAQLQAGVVLSDANPDPIILGAQYAAQISINESALTGISNIDDATKDLAKTLSKTLDAVDRLPGTSAQNYGTEVHFVFAAAVRAQALFGKGNYEVEVSFDDEEVVPYGTKGSIRTDVILRNDAGEIIAIYDLKTGESGISSSRAAKLRAKAGVGPNVPVIELHAVKGVLRKGRTAPLPWVSLFWRK
jgi:hypothetical protein